MHRELANEAIEVLKDFPEVVRLVFYGSVMRGDFSQNSDIDIAVICDDYIGDFQTDLNGQPIDLIRRINQRLNPLSEKYNGIRIDAPVYYNTEYEKGILLEGDRGKANLSDIGKVVYEAFSVS